MNFMVKGFGFFFLIYLTSLVWAQQPSAEDIVARVNNDVITRSEYLAAVRDYKEDLTRSLKQQGKNEAEINSELKRIEPTILDTMIDDLLLEQKAKELGYEAGAEFNRQDFENKMGCCYSHRAEFEEALRSQGVDPVRALSFNQKAWLRQYLIQREVLQPIFDSITDQERRDYYDQNRKHFITPGEMVLSEIFLPFEEKAAIEVEQQAKMLVHQLRTGLSFVEAVQKHTPATRPSYGQEGKIGSYRLSDLRKDIARAIASLDAGEFIDPCWA